MKKSETYARPADGEKFQASQREAGRTFYHTMPWRNFRAKKLKRDRARHYQIAEKMLHDGDITIAVFQNWVMSNYPACELSLQDGRLIPGRVLDHITPIKQGGAKFDESNLQWLSDYQHNRKRGREDKR